MSSWEYPVTPGDSTSFLPPPAPAGPLGEVITIAHTKGGAGKTSLTFNLAFALSTCGARVLVIDLDQQNGQTVFLGEAGTAARLAPRTPRMSAPFCSAGPNSRTR